MRRDGLDRLYINAEKEYILSHMYLVDAGYSLQDVLDIEGMTASDSTFRGENEIEERYRKALIAEENLVNDLIGEGYTTEDFTELYEIAESEVYNEKAEDIVYKF